MTTLSSVIVPLPARTSSITSGFEQQPKKKEERVIFLLQEEGVEAIQTTSSQYPYKPTLVVQQQEANDANAATKKSTLIEKYQRYNQYQRRTSGPSFGQRANAVARLFHQHLLLHKRTDETPLLEELIHQFSEFWIQTRDELAIPTTDAPTDQIQFGLLVYKKRFAAILNEIGSLYEKENTFDGSDITFDNFSIRLEFLRVIHGYYRLQEKRYSSTTATTLGGGAVVVGSSLSATTTKLPLETPALLEYALLLGRAVDEDNNNNNNKLEDSFLDDFPPHDDQISAISGGTGTGTYENNNSLPSSIKIPDDVNPTIVAAADPTQATTTDADDESSNQQHKLNSDPRMLDLILHIAIKALPPACSTRSSMDPAALSSSSCGWFPTRLKIETILFAVDVLQSQQACVSHKQNACHLLLVATTLTGITCGVFEGLEAVSTLTQCLRRRKDSGPITPCGFRKEASQALKAILALPATI